MDEGRDCDCDGFTEGRWTGTAVTVTRLPLAVLEGTTGNNGPELRFAPEDVER